MNTSEKFVITISREIGSCGHTVGRILSEKLGVRYSDKDLIRGLEKEFNLTRSGIEKLKGEKKNWLSDFLTHYAPVPNAKELLGADSKYTVEFRPDITTADVYEAECEILKGIADEGSCVIAGRSGFFVLKDHPNKVDIFITASRENRIARVMKKQGLDLSQAQVLIDGIDKARDNYVSRFTDRSRYDSRNYDLVINADGHTEKEIADIILTYLGL